MATLGADGHASGDAGDMDGNADAGGRDDVLDGFEPDGGFDDFEKKKIWPAKGNAWKAIGKHGCWPG